ncbi:MAG: hypothetical protein ABL911_11910 [Gallionella sp.]
MSRVLLVVSLALSLVACFSMSPRADEWTFWKSDRAMRENDVLRVMLECGHRMYADAYEYDEARRNPVSHMTYLGREVLTDRCMEKEGFRYTSEIGTTCKGGRYSRAYPELPECQLPIEQIPSRDINKRLTSPYCTKFPTAELCKP